MYMCVCVCVLSLQNPIGSGLALAISQASHFLQPPPHQSIIIERMHSGTSDQSLEEDLKLFKKKKNIKNIIAEISEEISWPVWEEGGL